MRARISQGEEMRAGRYQRLPGSVFEPQPCTLGQEARPGPARRRACVRLSLAGMFPRGPARVPGHSRSGRWRRVPEGWRRARAVWAARALAPRRRLHHVHVSNDDTQRAEPYAALVARRLHPVHGAATNSTCRDLLARLVPPLRAPGARVGRRVAPNGPHAPPMSHVRASGARIPARNWRGPSISYQEPSSAAMVRTGSG